MDTLFAPQGSVAQVAGFFNGLLGDRTPPSESMHLMALRIRKTFDWHSGTYAR